jgi:hypothetical protein
MFETPILFLIFNRPDTTKVVFERIKEIKPKYLFVAADGPRDISGEKEKCEQTRSIVLDGIDWECEVKTLFRIENLGCGVAPAEAITWFFNEVEQGIILEDDCLPDLSFFNFCETLLDHYKKDASVMHISGNNFQLGSKIGDGSYYFSNIPHSWGWATWRRVWKHFDWELEGLEEIIKSNKKLDPYWIETFQMVKKNKQKDIWDFQYTYILFKYSGKAILPNINLVRNIGFNENATHTKDAVLYYYNQEFGSINTITHPSSNTINEAADRFTLDAYFIQNNKFSTRIRFNIKRIKDKIRKIISNL